MKSRPEDGVCEPGPFTPDMVREGSRYEIHDGHPVWCAPSGGRHSSCRAVGALALASDPAAAEIGTETGYKIGDRELRAPDIAIGNVPDRPGWVAGVPRVAVEYADRGQDEGDLQDRIGLFLAGGTEAVWVVRLDGPRRVEVYTPDGSVRLQTAGETLVAPGVLERPVPVEALYDREAGLDLALSNLLRRRGYKGPDATREERRKEGREEGRLSEARALLRRLYARRGWPLDGTGAANLDSCRDLERPHAWIDAALAADSPEGLLD